MRIYKATYRNTNPQYDGVEDLDRPFMDRAHALRWLRSYGLGKYNEHYIDGELVTDELKQEMANRIRARISTLEEAEVGNPEEFESRESEIQRLLALLPSYQVR